MIRRAVVAPPCLIAAAAGCCTVLLLDPRGSANSLWIVGVLIILPFLAGRAPVWPVGALALGLILGGVVGNQVIAFENSIVPGIMIPLTLYLAGLALRGREAMVRRLAVQSDELELERDAYARLSVRYERARIAAELHDVVAHAISVMVVQASAGQRLAVHYPDRAAGTFDVIATAARQAQADLDRLAALLGQDPVPSTTDDLTLVHEIVATAAASGLPVTLRVVGDLAGVSDATAHAALRVVQEALTNALRYAPGAEAAVTVEARPGAVELSVINSSSAAPARQGLGCGRGLIGLRERVDACGGTLQAGPDGEGGWSVRARIADGRTLLHSVR